jgi:hypothetical protein
VTNPLFFGLPPAVVRMKARREFAAFREAQRLLADALIEQRASIERLARVIDQRDDEPTSGPPALQ